MKYSSLFGNVKLGSPYLWDKQTGRGARPVKDKLGIEHGGRSLAVEQALSDFGAEESFGQASIRFEERYGWTIYEPSKWFLWYGNVFKALQFSETWC